MEFRIIGKEVFTGFFWRKDIAVMRVSTATASEAREFALASFPRAKEIRLYQLFLEGDGEVPGEWEFRDYSRSWLWKPRKGWFRRVCPDRLVSLSEAPDSATNKEIEDKYLALLGS